MSDMLVHTFNLSTWEAEAEGHFKFNITTRLYSGLYNLQSKTLSQKAMKKGRKGLHFPTS